MGSSGDLRALTRLRADALIGVPGYVYHLLRRAVADGLDLSSIRCVVLGAERVPPGMKAKIVQLLTECGAQDVKVFGTYGFTEARMAWAECPTKDNAYTGYHLYPDMAIFEVIDPKTGEVLPDGEDGELVFTPLQARASTVFRYRTGDLVRGGLQHDPCPHCGRTVPRISSDLTRESSLKDLQLLKVKGTLVNLEDCAMILGSMQPRSRSGRSSCARRTTTRSRSTNWSCTCPCKSGSCEQQVAKQVQETSSRAVIEISPNRGRVPRARVDAATRSGWRREMKEKRFVDSRPKV